MELKIHEQGTREYQKRLFRLGGRGITEIWKSVDELDGIWELKRELVNRKAT